MTLYWAYGSNLNVGQMSRRCPGARQVAPLTVPNKVLRFRHVADVAHLEGAKCPGAVWDITDVCEEALDTYEGVDGGLYEKVYLCVDRGDGPEDMLYYRMLRKGIMPPSDAYLKCIERGYRDWGLPLEALDRAVEHSWNRRYKTPDLRARYARRGSPPLAPTNIVRSTRCSLKLTVSAMAKKIGVSERSVRRWEHDPSAVPERLRSNLEELLKEDTVSA